MSITSIDGSIELVFLTVVIVQESTSSETINSSLPKIIFPNELLPVPISHLLIKKFSLYNKIYFSNIDLGLFTYLEIIIFFHVFSSSNLNLDANKKTRSTIFNKLDIGKTENSKRNKRKSGNLGLDIIDKLTKPFTSRYNEKSNINKTEIANNIIMTEYNDNHHHNQINYINESSKDNFIMNDINNIPNLYLFDNENIKFPNNPNVTVFMIQNYLKLLSFF